MSNKTTLGCIAGGTGTAGEPAEGPGHHYERTGVRGRAAGGQARHGGPQHRGH